MYHLTRISGNAKTGPIPVSTSSRDTCPTACPLYGNGCYGESGPIRLHWNKVTEGERGGELDHFTDAIKALPRGQLWRHNQVGDLPKVGENIDRMALTAIVKANKGKRGFTYTHHDLSIPGNRDAIEQANAQGFTVNISCNTVTDAVALYGTVKAPVVTLLPMDAPNSQTVAGVRVVACPAEKSDKVNCATCALCADSKRDYVIGFRAHGTSKKKANIIAKG